MKYYIVYSNEVDLYLDVDGNHDCFKLNGGNLYEVDKGYIPETIKHGGWLLDSTNSNYRVIAEPSVKTFTKSAI